MSTKRYEESNGYWIEATPRDDGGLLAYDLLVGCGAVKAKASFRLEEPSQLFPAIMKGAPKGISTASHFFCGTVARHSARAWIDALWAEQKAARDAACEAELARENAIEGLSELRAAYADANRYQREFTRMMEDEDNDGVCPPRSARGDIAGLRRKYPRAAMFLRAESYECAAHWAKAKAGREATEIVLAGGDLAAAEAKLENWLTDNNVEVD